MYVWKHVDRSYQYPKLDCTGEGSWLMLYDVSVGRGASWECIYVVYCM